MERVFFFQLSIEKFLTYNRRCVFRIARSFQASCAAASSFARFRRSFSSCFRSTAFLEWVQLRRR